MKQSTATLRSPLRMTIAARVADVPSLLRDPLNTFLSAWRVRGEVVRLRIPTQKAFLVVHPDHVRHVLHEQRSVYVRDAWHTTQLHKVSGNGLTASEGELWSQQRHLLRAPLGALVQMRPSALAATDRMLARWRRIAATGGTIDLQVEMLRVSLEIIFACLFSADLGRTSPILVRDAATVLDHLYARLRVPSPLLAPALAPERKSFRLARNSLYTLAERLLCDRECARAADSYQPDLLDALSGLRERELACDQIVTMALAGHDTTGTALAWACHVLATRPAIAQRLHEHACECDTARTRTTVNCPTAQLYSEALRLFPPAWTLSRTPIDDDVIGGTQIPAGATVFISPYVTHRHPSFWRAPERVDPDRFATRSQRAPGVQKHPYAYLPFGAGPRSCIGKGLAEMTGRVVLSAVSRAYRLRPVYSGAPQPRARLTLKPDRPLRVHLEPRP